MKKIIIQENERGFLFRNGRFVKMLDSGKYYTFQNTDIQVVSMDDYLRLENCRWEVLRQNPEVVKQTEEVTVPDEMLALHYVNDGFYEMLRPGSYVFWKEYRDHRYVLVNTAEPEVSADVPRYIFAHMSRLLYQKVEVASYEKGLLYYNRRFVKVLEPGTYYFWRGATEVVVDTVDMRLTQMTVAGQEMLTQDKVTLRVNFVCNYRICDAIKAKMEIDDVQEQLHVAAQLTLREYVGARRIDEILEERNAMSAYVLEQLQEKAKAFYLEVTDVGIRDVILPGEIRDIMNTVLVAEKRAQANVITRREEVASTRSLLNTAKLMDENQTLYKLKELEYLEKICENVGNITVNGNTDLLSQLTTIMRGGEK